MDLGISQRQMAERLGVDEKSVQTWERNEVRPSRILAHELRGFLGFDIPAPPSPFAGRLLAFRRSRRLTHAQVAKLLGVHRRTVIGWETGRTCPSKSLLGRIDALFADPPQQPARE
jgi:DNA-binding XRE family transcriptional regulator